MIKSAPINAVIVASISNLEGFSFRTGIDIRIAKTPDGKPRGFAHVDFDSKEGMENALEKNGYRLDQRDLRIDKTTNQPSSNKKTFGENL